MIYINRKPSVDYSTVIIGLGDFVQGLNDYVLENDWIWWVPMQNRTLQIKKEEDEPSMNLSTFISWVEEKGHQCLIRDNREDDWEPVMSFPEQEENEE